MFGGTSKIALERYPGKSPAAYRYMYFGKSPAAYCRKTSCQCHTIEITASRARPRLRAAARATVHAAGHSWPAVRRSQRHAADIASPCRQRAARRLDQLRVRGRTLLRHPRPAVDRVPGRQPRHGGAPRVLTVHTRELRATLIDSRYPATVTSIYLPVGPEEPTLNTTGPTTKTCGAVNAVHERNH